MTKSKRKSGWLTTIFFPVLVCFALALNFNACGKPPVPGEEPGGEKVAESTGESTVGPEAEPTVGPEAEPTTGPEAEPTTTPEDGGTTPEDGGTTVEVGPEPDTQSGGGLNVTGTATNQRAPFDATPGPDGKFIYYTALKTPKADEPPNQEGQGTLFKVEAKAGATPTELATGFLSPISLVVSTDGTKIFVADSGVGKEDDEVQDKEKSGAIYTVASSGGTPTVVTGTEGYKPRGLDLVKEVGDLLYFTGTDPSSGEPGVFRMDAAGGNITTVLKGSPLSDPSGIAVASNGDIYVTDTTAGNGDQAVVIKITNGAGATFVEGLRTGYPAGIALTKDNKNLLVSGLDRQTNNAVVYQVEIASKKVTPISDGLSQNSESGGVHRAHNADVYAWANCDFPNEDGTGGGTVYLITPK